MRKRLLLTKQVRKARGIWCRKPLLLRQQDDECSYFGFVSSPQVACKQAKIAGINEEPEDGFFRRSTGAAHSHSQSQVSDSRAACGA